MTTDNLGKTNKRQKLCVCKCVLVGEYGAPCVSKTISALEGTKLYGARIRRPTFCGHVCNAEITSAYAGIWSAYVGIWSAYAWMWSAYAHTDACICMHRSSNRCIHIHMTLIKYEYAWIKYYYAGVKYEYALIKYEYVETIAAYAAILISMYKVIVSI